MLSKKILLYSAVLCLFSLFYFVLVFTSINYSIVSVHPPEYETINSSVFAAALILIVLTIPLSVFVLRNNYNNKDFGILLLVLATLSIIASLLSGSKYSRYISPVVDWDYILVFFIYMFVACVTIFSALSAIKYHRLASKNHLFLSLGFLVAGAISMYCIIWALLYFE